MTLFVFLILLSVIMNNHSSHSFAAGPVIDYMTSKEMQTTGEIKSMIMDPTPSANNEVLIISNNAQPNAMITRVNLTFNQTGQTSFTLPYELTYLNYGETRVIKMFSVPFLSEESGSEYQLLCLVDDSINKRYKLVRFRVLATTMDRIDEVLVTRYEDSAVTPITVSISQSKTDAKQFVAVYKDLDGWFMKKVQLARDIMKSDQKQLNIIHRYSVNVLWTSDDDYLYGVESAGVSLFLRTYQVDIHTPTLIRDVSVRCNDDTTSVQAVTTTSVVLIEQTNTLAITIRFGTGTNGIVFVDTNTMTMTANYPTSYGAIQLAHVIGSDLLLYTSFSLPGHFNQIETVTNFSLFNQSHYNVTSVVARNTVSVTTASTINLAKHCVHFVTTSKRKNSFNTLTQQMLYSYDLVTDTFEASLFMLDAFIDRPSCLLSHGDIISVATRDLPGKVIQYRLNEANVMERIRTLVLSGNDITHCLQDSKQNIGYFISRRAASISKVDLETGTILSEFDEGDFFTPYDTDSAESPFIAHLHDEYIYLLGIKERKSVMLRLETGNIRNRVATGLQLEQHVPPPLYFGYGSFLDHSPVPGIYFTILYRSLDHIWKRNLVKMPFTNIHDITMGTISETEDEKIQPQIPCMFKHGGYVYAALNLPNKSNCTIIRVKLDSDLEGGRYQSDVITYLYTRNVNHPSCSIYSCVVGKYGMNAYFTTRHSKLLLKADLTEQKLVVRAHYDVGKELGSAILVPERQVLIAASYWDVMAPELFLFDAEENLPRKNKALLTAIIVPVLAALVGLVVLLLVVFVPVSIKACVQHRKLKRQREIEADLNRQLLSTFDMLEDTTTSSKRSVYSLDTGKNWIISMQDIEIQKRISEGAFSTVFRAKWRKGGVDVAVKRMKHSDSEEDEETFLNEARTLLSIRHVNILLFLGISVEGSHRFIITEYMKNGSLDDLYRSSVGKQSLKCVLPFAEKIRMLCEICQALLYLHTHDPVIIHRDLKPQNILLDEHLHVKLCDFGLSKPVANSMTSGVGTFEYCSPEVLVNSRYSEMADIYSFAIVMFELLFEMHPFHNLTGSTQSGIQTMHQFQLGIDIVNNSRRPQIPYAGEELERWADINEIPLPVLDTYLDIMRKCWLKEPRDRYPTSDLLRVLTELKEDLNNHSST